MQKDLLIISTQLPDQYERLKNRLTGNFVLFNFPMIQIEYLPVNPEIEAKIEALNSFSWIVYTSMRGVTGFFEQLKDSGIPLGKSRFPKIACIGDTTANELKKFGFKASYINPGNTSNEFSGYLLKDVLLDTDNVLLVLGERADNRLEKSVQQRCGVSRINVYKTVDVEYFDETFKGLVESNQYDLLVFTSPSAFENFLRLGKFKPELNQFRILSIGERTTEMIENLGYRVLITAHKSSIEGLSKEILNYDNRK